LARILIAGVLGVALFSQHAFAEEGALDLTLEYGGYLVLGITIVGRIWCSAHLSGNKNTSVVRAGPYSMCRNPLYFFTLLGFVGLGFSLESLTLTGCLILAFFLTHWPIILREESFLREKFGEPYAAYCNEVPRLLPNPFLHRSDAQITFGAEPFLRATGDSLLLLLVFPLCHLLEHLHAAGHVPVLFRLY
jgi:protein-S-isoprenylcysteine O-methyltransferase Ste14